MRKKHLLCFAIILSMMFCLFSRYPAVAANTEAAAKTAAKAVIPEIQKQYYNVLIQMEIIPKPAKSVPKLSDKIKSNDFTKILNNAMSIVPDPAIIQKSDNKEVYITFVDAQKLVLTALGYESAIEGYNPEQILSKANELGLSTDLALPVNRQITYGEATVLIYNSLTVEFAIVE